MFTIQIPALVLAAALLGAHQEEENRYTNEELGIALTLPDKSWKLTDQSQGAAKVLIFSPREDMSVRTCVLYLPAAALPEGLITRENQIKSMMGDRYQRTHYGSDTLGGKDAMRLEYESMNTLTREYGIEDGEFLLIFQLSAPQGKWQDEAGRAQLEAIAASLVFTGEAQVEIAAVDRSTPDEVRARRREAREKEEREFELSRHELLVELAPAEHALKIRDRITLKSLKEGLDEIELYFSIVSVDAVEPASRIKWGVEPASGRAQSELTLEVAPPLKKGEELVVVIEASSGDYVQNVEGGLIQEIAVVGQVRERSSFSSHVFYYPLDERNDAAMDITFKVPEGYTALTGGDLVESGARDGFSTFRYKTDRRRSRLLPFGFAAGRYRVEKGRSAQGLVLSVYGYEGEEKLIAQRLEVAVEAANLFEKMMGPLPIGGVRFAHVSPEKKEMGVSLPGGLILISDGFFADLDSVDLSDGRLNNKEALSLLIVVDELSHQWNFYSVPLPNELAEGVSTFTNALFVEHRHGREVYRKAIDFCKDAYLISARLDRDVAIADPAIYRSTAYRGIAFCKVPVVLDMIRTRLGDEVFFSGWREAFLHFNEEDDGYDILERSFAKVSGQNMRPFFDQWFFTAGCPEIAVAFIQEGGTLSVEIRQVQEGLPYDLEGDLLIRGKSGETMRRPVTLTAGETFLSLEVGFEVQEAVFDPDGLLLIRQADG